jgi:hypothetical protein
MGSGERDGSDIEKRGGAGAHKNAGLVAPVQTISCPLHDHGLHAVHIGLGVQQARMHERCLLVVLPALLDYVSEKARVSSATQKSWLGFG